MELLNQLEYIVTTNKKPDCCVLCGADSIYNKRRKLCAKCYRWGRSRGLLRYPLATWEEVYEKNKYNNNIDSRTRKLRNIKNNYGAEFFKDVKKVNNNYAWTLTSLANKYNISRERARQFYNIIYGHGFRKQQRAKKERFIEQDYTTCINDFRHKKAEYQKGSHIYDGVVAKSKFAEKLNLFNIDWSVSCTRGTDFIVNNKKIVVRKCESPKKVNSGFYYFVSVTEAQRNKCDFIVVFCEDIGEFFILPNKEKGMNVIGKRTLCLPTEVKKGHQAKNNDLLLYKNAFYVLRRG